MSVFGALNAAVAGLRSQSYALENISDNIANSQTVGYKRVDTSFEELVPDLQQRQQLGGSVSAFSRGTNTIGGNITATGVGTNIALSGDGFFVVRGRDSFSGGVPTFSGKNLYSRRGDFELDKNGYLVNGANNYLVGTMVDPITGQLSAAGPGVMQLNSNQVPAVGTTVVNYKANLPSSPVTSGGGTNLLPAGQTTITNSGESAFLNQTISGGTLTVYDKLGTPVTLQLRWGKTADANPNATPPVADSWDLFYANSPTSTAAGNTAWTKVSSFTFNGAGQLTSPSTGSATITAPSIGGKSLGNLTVDFSGGGLTQFADVSGQLRPTTLKQNGYAAGSISKISIDSSGAVTASYSNGQTKTVGQLAIAQFNAGNGLKRLNGGAFEETTESGAPVYSMGNSNIVSGSIEGSNTDIAEEFSKMIITQQAYSANTRVVTTSQQMLQDAINIIR